MIFKKYKTLRNSIIISALSVAVAHFYFDGHKLPANQLTEAKKIDFKNKIKIEEVESGEPASLSHPEKAVIVLEKSNGDLNAPPVYRVILPKGKRLYNEEKMEEYAQDANIETLSLEDANI